MSEHTPEPATGAGGPRTSEGKQRSSQNALKHGVFSSTIVLPGESQEEFDALLLGMQKEFAPGQTSETEMVVTLAETLWRMKRLRRIESIAIDRDMEKALETGDLESKSMLNFSLYEQRLNRLFQSTLKMLHNLQAARRERDSQMIDDAIALRKYYLKKKMPWNPADAEFVFSTEYLDRKIAFRTDLALARTAPVIDIIRRDNQTVRSQQVPDSPVA